MHQYSKLLFLCVIIGAFGPSLLMAQEEDSAAPREIEIHFCLKDADDESFISARFASSSPLQTVLRFIEATKYEHVSSLPMSILSEQISLTTKDATEALPRENRLAQIALGRKRLNLYLITK